MQWKPRSSRYRNCISRFSRMATSTASSARKVLSSSRPVRTFFSLVRTKAPPLPGLTCWNSTTFIRLPSMFSVIPFFRSLVVGMLASCANHRAGAPGRAPGGGRLESSGYSPSLNDSVCLQFEEILGCGGEQVVAVLADDREILDPDPAEAGKVDTWLHGDGRSGGDPTRGACPHPGRLVDLQADPVADRVAEVVAVAGRGDHLTGGAVDLAAADPGAQRGDARGLGLAHQLVELPLAPGGAAEHFFFSDTAAAEIYTLSLHDALPI